jgi:hypothetical protein
VIETASDTTLQEKDFDGIRLTRAPSFEDGS